MKNIFKLSTYFFMAACFSFLLTGCDNDDDPAGATVTSVNPTEAYPRSTVILEGSNFGNVQYVFLGTRAVEFTAEGSTITFDIPEGTVAGETEITLAMPEGVRATAMVNVLPSADPIFNNFSARAARVGQQVTITGGSLDGAESVTVGGVEAEINSSSANSLTFTVPAGVPDKRGPVRVITNRGEKTADFTFYVGKETLVTDFDGNGLGEWGNMGGAVDADASGVKSSNPAPIDGNFFRMVMTSGGWGGSQIEVPAGFGLTAPRENVLLVADVNTNGTSPNYRFNVAEAGDARFWSSYQGATTGWETLEIPLTNFGWSYSGDGPTQEVEGQAIDPAALRIIKVQWGTVEAGKEVSFDNIRFIEFFD